MNIWKDLYCSVLLKWYTVIVHLKIIVFYLANVIIWPLIKFYEKPWPVWPVHQKAAPLIPGLGTCLAWGLHLSRRHAGGSRLTGLMFPCHINVSLSSSPFPSKYQYIHIFFNLGENISLQRNRFLYKILTEEMLQQKSVYLELHS